NMTPSLLIRSRPKNGRTFFERRSTPLFPNSCLTIRGNNLRDPLLVPDLSSPRVSSHGRSDKASPRINTEVFTQLWATQLFSGPRKGRLSSSSLPFVTPHLDPSQDPQPSRINERRRNSDFSPDLRPF
ncbi:Hypothetical predicted protein, partial [Marmota monax]